MPKIPGAATGRAAAGLAFMVGLATAMSGSASAAPASPVAPAQQNVRTQQVADVPPGDMSMPPAASARTVRVPAVVALAQRELSRPAAPAAVRTVRGPAVRSARPVGPPPRLGPAASYIRLANGTVVRVQ